MTDQAIRRYRHILDWNVYKLEHRRGHKCEILRSVGGKSQIQFADGTTAIIDRRAIRRMKPSEIEREEKSLTDAIEVNMRR